MAPFVNHVLKMMFLTKLLGAATLALTIALAAAVAAAQVEGGPAESVGQDKPLPVGKPKEAETRPARQPSLGVDRFGDPLPNGAVARLGSLRFRYEGPAQEALAYSPDGKILAGVFSRGILLWGAGSGRELRRLPVRVSALWSRPFDFSPDGTTVAALDLASKIHLWDSATGRPLRTLAAPNAAHYQGDILRYSPDGNMLAVGWRENGVHLLDAATGKEVRKIQLDRRQAYNFAFAPDGKTLAVVSSNPCATLWDVATGKLVRGIDLMPKDKIASCVAFTRDGKRLAIGGWDQIVVAETASGEEIARFEAKCESVDGLAFAADGKTLFASSQDGKLRIWDLAEKKLRAALDSRHRYGRCLALSPDGKTIALGTGGSFVKLWDVDSGRELFTEYPGPDSRIARVVFSRDGRTLFAAEENRRVHVWDAATWREKRVFEAASDPALTPDGKQMVWVDAKNTIHLRDLDADKDRWQWQIPGQNMIYWPIFAGDADRLLTTDYQRDRPTPPNPERWGTTRLVVWDARTGKSQREIVVPHFAPLCQAVSLEGGTAYLGGFRRPASENVPKSLPAESSVWDNARSMMFHRSPLRRTLPWTTPALTTMNSCASALNA